MIGDVINEMCVSFSIGTYLLYVVRDNDLYRMGCRNGAVPRFIQISDNSFIQFTPGPYAEPGGVYLSCYFTFHRNYYIRMPQLTTPYDFALAVYNGLTQTNLENAYTYSNREITISFKQPSRVYFASPVTLLDEGGSEASPGTASLFHDSPLLPLASFVDWEQPQTYMANTTMRFPYGVMTLDEGGSSAFLEADITSTDDTQTFTRTTCSRSVATLTRLYPLQDRNRIHGASLLTMVCTMPTMVRWWASILWISRMVYRTYGCVATS